MSHAEEKGGPRMDTTPTPSEVTRPTAGAARVAVVADPDCRRCYEQSKRKGGEDIYHKKLG
jgi:hypothetical protein